MKLAATRHRESSSEAVEKYASDDMAKRLLKIVRRYFPDGYARVACEFDIATQSYLYFLAVEYQEGRAATYSLCVTKSEAELAWFPALLFRRALVEFVRTIKKLPELRAETQGEPGEHHHPSR